MSAPKTNDSSINGKQMAMLEAKQPQMRQNQDGYEANDQLCEPRQQNSGIDGAVSVSDLSDLEHHLSDKSSDLASEEQCERDSGSESGSDSCQEHGHNIIMQRAPLLELKIEKVFALEHYSFDDSDRVARILPRCKTTESATVSKQTIAKLQEREKTQLSAKSSSSL